MTDEQKSQVKCFLIKKITVIEVEEEEVLPTDVVINEETNE